MQREDPQGALGSPQAPRASKGVEVYQKKDKSSLLQCWDTMLKDFFPNSLHIPGRLKKKKPLEGRKKEESMNTRPKKPPQNLKKKSTFIINK